MPLDVPLPLWDRETVFVLGGGPGLNVEVVEKIRDAPAIAVNCACYVAPQARVLFFSDRTWLVKHRPAVDRWSGLAFTTTQIAAEHLPQNVKRLRFEDMTRFPERGFGLVRGGRSSGHRAVGLAIACGAARVCLLGFDMRVVDGRSHFHDKYPVRDSVLYTESFIPAFYGWREQARAVGVCIVNATPGSALDEFPHVGLDEVLG